MPKHWTQRLQSSWQARMHRSPMPTPAPRPLLRTVLQRTEVFPPERLYRATRWRAGLRDWLNTGWDVSTPAPLEASPSRALAPQANALPMAELRKAFAEALDDIDADIAQPVCNLIARARAPRELWHLRTAVYTLIATQHSESQAQLRMNTLNCHFPQRTLCAGLWSR